MNTEIRGKDSGNSLPLSDISTVAEKLNIDQGYLKRYGKFAAKLDLEAIPSAQKSRGKLILVSSMTATPAGEGKTVTSIGLSMALNRLGRSAVVCLRQPSLGPVFGVKGGAAGGGKSTVEPMQEINLRFTGDIDAIGAAHNLLSAMLDNHLFHGNALAIDPRTIGWKRAMDMNERFLRHTVIGLGGKNNGVPREDGFVITAASEVMAILCMARGYDDLKQRLGRIIVGYSREKKPARAIDLKASGAMAAILKDAMKPNLVQTAEGSPALIHGGPFANIALGTCSLTSISLALNHAEFAVVETGFATDLGAEKFFDVVSRIGGFQVDCVVTVSSVRSIASHGRNIAPALLEADKDTKKKLRDGLDNLGKHIENIRMFGVEPVIAINRFAADTEEELQLVKDFCQSQGVSFAVSTAFTEGSAGSLELAERAIEACAKPHTNKPVYSFKDSIQLKIERIVTLVYGGDKADYEPEAMAGIRQVEAFGLDLPICMAKTQFSLSDDPKKLGRPRGFTATVRRTDLAAGAGFLIAHLGDIVSMPGLPVHPAAENIDIDQNGAITGVY